MKHLFTRFLAMMLSVALLIELLRAVNAVTTNAVEVAEGYADSRVIGEINEERTETGKRFRLADGSYAAVEYGAPVHFADADGSWQDIDNTLEQQNIVSTICGTEGGALTAMGFRALAGALTSFIDIG